MVNDIITVYDDASLNGEDQEMKLYLLKDVGKMTENVDEDTTASGFIEDISIGTEDPIESYYDPSIKMEKQFESYAPKFDTRDISGYVSLISQTAEKATDQNFTGSFADDVIDDVKLAISHYITYSNNQLTTEQVSEINSALSSALSGIDTPSEDTDPVEDITIYLNGYYECTDPSHYDIPASASSQDVEVTSAIMPVKHTVVKVNGSEIAHKSGSYDGCRKPFLKISYKIDKGIKSTGVILHGGDMYFAYLIKGRELLTYDKYTNKYAFAHLESGNLKSTTFKHWEFAWQAKNQPEDSYETWFVEDAFEGIDYEIDTSNVDVKFKINDWSKGTETWSNHDISDYSPNGAIDIQTIIDGLDIKPEEIYQLLFDDPSINASMIFPEDSFAIVRDVKTVSGGGAVPSRVENEFQNNPELAKMPENAYLKIGDPSLVNLGRNAEAQCSYTDQPGETILTQTAYLNLKNANKRSDQELYLNVSAVEGFILGKIREALNSQVSGKEIIQNYMFKNKLGPDSGSYGSTSIPTYRQVNNEECKTTSEDFEWSYTGGSFDLGSVSVKINFHVVFPTRVSVEPISQRVIDKEMPAYFVKYANYWAAEKDFHNVLKIQGEFKDHGDWHYLVTNNSDAQGIKDIISEYKSIKWRCDLFAPIFGSVRKDNSGREADIKLILSEWEKVAQTGVGAADHAIRDLYALIMYSKGIRDTGTSNQYDKSNISFVPGFEPKKRSNGEPMINENSYSYLYIPYEILGYDPLNSEKAFWLDRIICTPNDAIYDKTISVSGSKQTNEAKLRSRTPIFTWQVVDYDLYDETEIIDSSGQHTGQHAVYALWLFGDQTSRMLYAISANASEDENKKIGMWGGTTTAHAAADLYGRTETERIYGAVFEGKRSIQSSRRTMVNQFYGYGYFPYGGVTSKLKARYVPSMGDVLLFEGDKEIREGETINIGGYDFSLDSDASLLEDVDWDNIDSSYNPSSTGGTGLYFNDTPVTLKLGKRTYTFNGTAAACYAYELYRQALVLKDTSGSAAEKIVKNKLEKEMKWQEVRAVAPGVVDAIGGDAVSGFWVKIVHSGPTKVGSAASKASDAPQVTTSYCHMKRYPVVQVGQYVGAGTVIGYEGTTGKSGGFHCHMNVRVGGTEAMPVKYMYPFFTPFWYADKAAQVLGAGINDEIDEEIMANYQDQALNGNDAFLDSDYFSSARTVFPFGQKPGTSNLNTGIQSVTDGSRAEIPSTTPMKQAETTSDGYLKIKNYTPQYALVSSVSYLKQEEDGTDFSALSTESNVSTDLGKPEYDGETLHTNPKFSDVDFMKKVMRNMGRIHGSYPGLMQAFSFSGGNVDKVAIWNELMLIIGNPYGVAGMMGNIQSESSFVSNNLNTKKPKLPAQYADVDGAKYTEMIDSGTCPQEIYTTNAYGLCQWLDGRQRLLIEYSKQFGVSVSDAGLQLNYLISELEGKNFGDYGSDRFDNYPDSIKSLKGKRTILEMLQDENLLLELGTHLYETATSRPSNDIGVSSTNFFDTVMKFKISELSGEDKVAALKTIGATTIGLYNYERPGSYGPATEAARSSNALNILAEMTDFGN